MTTNDKISKGGKDLARKLKFKKCQITNNRTFNLLSWMINVDDNYSQFESKFIEF